MTHVDKQKTKPEIAGRYYNSIHEWNTQGIARGSVYVGSWRPLQGILTKSVHVRASMSGSLHIMSTIEDENLFEGTYYSSRIGHGTYTTFTWTEAMKKAKVQFQASGTTTTGKGTLSLGWGLQA